MSNSPYINNGGVGRKVFKGGFLQLIGGVVAKQTVLRRHRHIQG